jgi:endonuclease/exonuclease/phosphatase family metal-dependent hydrolase
MPTEISIVTYNVKCLPTEPTREWRIEQICKEIHRLGFDIVCLQELFDERCRNIVIRDLQHSYPHMVAKSTFRLPGVAEWINWLEDSGLFVASKYPITWHNFQPFWDVAGYDGLAWKGILGMTIDLNQKKRNHSLMLFTTHLQAGHEWAVKQKQITTMVKFIQQQRYDAAVLCGDLNIDESNKEQYKYLIEQLDATDVFRKAHPNDAGYTVDGTLNKNMMNSNRQVRYDYIFDLTRNNQASESQIVYFKKPLYDLYSDHFGVGASLAVNGTNNKGTQGTSRGPWIPRIVCCCQYCY